MKKINDVYNWYGSLSETWQTAIFSAVLVPIVFSFIKLIFNKNNNYNVNKSTANNTVYDLYVYLRKHDKILSILRDWIILFTIAFMVIEIRGNNTLWSLLISIVAWYLFSKYYTDKTIKKFNMMIMNNKLNKKNIIKLFQLIQDSQWKYEKLKNNSLLILNIKHDTK